jgi:hypothetical protein
MEHVSLFPVDTVKVSSLILISRLISKQVEEGSVSLGLLKYSIKTKASSDFGKEQMSLPQDAFLLMELNSSLMKF